MKSYLKKFAALFMSLCVLIGCFGTGAFAETVYIDRKADVVFVIDATGSMGGYISGVKTNLTSFISTLSEEGVDVRTRFVVYRDITEGEYTTNSEWFTKPDRAIEYLNAISATGGGDGPETAIDGLGQMFVPSFGFRSDAARFCVLLTDADYKIDNRLSITSDKDIIDRLPENNIHTSVITRPGYFSLYGDFVSKGHSTSGEDAGVLADISGSYAILLKKLAEAVIESGKTVYVKRMNPNYGEVGVAEKVTVTADNLEYGDNFRVTLGGKKVEIVSELPDSFTFLTPDDLPVGEYEVTIRNNNGNVSSAGIYTYFEKADEDAPKITSATPYSFVEKTETTITIKGRNFSSPTVYIGDTAVTVTEAASASLTVKTGTDIAAGKYDLKIVNDDGKSVRAPKYFNVTLAPLFPAPTITSVSPNTTDEGTSVRIRIDGTHFSKTKAGNTVMLGTTKLSVNGVGAGYIIATVPKTMAAGVYDLTVTNSDSEIATMNKAFTVKGEEPDIPTISAVSPNTVDEGSSVRIRIDGTNFAKSKAGNTVMLGTTKLSVNGVGAGYIIATVPKTMTAGVYDLTVTNDEKQSATMTNAFTVKGEVPPPVIKPTITSISPNSTEAGTSVRIRIDGTNFAKSKAGNTVMLGTTKLSVNGVGAGYIIATVPKTMTAGVYDLTVTNDEKQSATMTGVFTVIGEEPDDSPVPTITSISPNSTEAGTSVRIRIDGTNFAKSKAGNTVMLGTTKLSVNGVGAGYIIATVPKTMTVGVYDLTVTNNYNKSATLAGAFEVT